MRRKKQTTTKSKEVEDRLGKWGNANNCSVFRMINRVENQDGMHQNREICSGQKDQNWILQR